MADNDDGWVYPRGHTYQPVMAEFMSLLHGAEEYDNGTVFTREQLLEIRPTDVKRFLCMKAYGDPDPNIEGGSRPKEGRSDSLYYLHQESIIQVHATSHSQLDQWARESNQVCRGERHDQTSEKV